MHELTEEDINPVQLKILNKAGYWCYEQLARLKPKKLYDCRSEMILSPENVGKNGMIVGTLQTISNRKAMSGMKLTEAIVLSENNKKFISVVWFNDEYIYKRYEKSAGQRVLLYGKIGNGMGGMGYQMVSPILFTDYPDKYEGKIIPANKKYRGMSNEYFTEVINATVPMELEEPFSKDFREKHSLMSINTLSENLHDPEGVDELAKAFKQVDVEDLVYFALNLSKNIADQKNEYPQIKSRKILDEAIGGLPFKLTDGQMAAVNGLAENMASKKEVNALVQGDVSCGKSIVAYLLILLLLENGYQGALLAPTVVLASQHYDDAKTFFSKYGYNVEFINGALKKKERTGLLKRLASGDIDVLVGTQAAVSDDVAFKNLGIAIVDEEQRFGVTCREKIKTKSVKPIFYITMSATPIPRTLATCIYGEGTGIYSIKSMPGGRQSVDTILTDSYKVPDILKSELAAGRQGYVVCALITEDNKNDDAEKEANPIISVEKTLAAYRRALPGYNIEALTGKTKDKECLQIMQDFKEGKINVLVSTTVIEVGVNNPNASVIVIQNAERFGLSTLHQLRGRVRRGSYKPYCILVSDKRDSERLDVLVRTEDGFELSMEDLNLRRSGNLIGTEQSGKNRFVELAIRKSEVFDYAKVLARELRERKEDETFLKFYNRLEQIS